MTSAHVQVQLDELRAWHSNNADLLQRWLDYDEHMVDRLQVHAGSECAFAEMSADHAALIDETKRAMKL